MAIFTSRAGALSLCLLLAACGSGNDNVSAKPGKVLAAEVQQVAAQPRVAADYFDVLQHIYVGYFGRPADPGGLLFYANIYLAADAPTNIVAIASAYNSNPAVAQLIDSFGTSQESKDLYPGDNGAFITAIYHNLFNREPDEAGKQFWVNAINAGAMTRAKAALNIMAGAQGSDIDVINKKAKVATDFATALNSPDRLKAYSGLDANVVVRTMLGTVNLATNVNTFQATIDATIAALLAKIDAVSLGTGQEGTDAIPISRVRLAVILVDFPDTPQATKNNFYPSVSQVSDYIFKSRIAAYLQDMSYGQLDLSGDVFGYFTHSLTGANTVSIRDDMAFLTIDSIKIPGFDPDRYDAIALIPVYDGPGTGVTMGTVRSPGSASPLSINGAKVTKPVIIVSSWVGYSNHDVNKVFMNQFKSEYGSAYFIPLPGRTFLSENKKVLSGFEQVFLHEFGHVIGLPHARSKTNGNMFDFQPEISANNCFCYQPQFEAKGGLLDADYGNIFDMMGDASGLTGSYNMAYRDLLGWTNDSNRLSIRGYGHYSATIRPMNEGAGLRAVEIRIPYQYSRPYKNRGYFLEVRSAASIWDSLLSLPQLLENTNGIMVNRIDGSVSHLLDMSPSPNLAFDSAIYPDRRDRIYADLRDIVLKQGMTYANSELRLSNVKRNADGTFTVDIDVLEP